MPCKYLLLILFATAVIASIWPNDRKQPIDPLQTETVTSPAGEQRLEYRSVPSVPEPSTKEYFERGIKNTAEITTVQALKTLTSEENAVSAATLFDGNSAYTGDDTEDNDAGNAGFEDDFPEAHLAYGNDYAEAYSNYSESYSDDE